MPCPSRSLLLNTLGIARPAHVFGLMLLGAYQDYPPCTDQLRDRCTEPAKPTWPTLYIPCPEGVYCPPYDIPHRLRHPNAPPVPDSR